TKPAHAAPAPYPATTTQPRQAAPRGSGAPQAQTSGPTIGESASLVFLQGLVNLHGAGRGRYGSIRETGEREATGPGSRLDPTRSPPGAPARSNVQSDCPNAPVVGSPTAFAQLARATRHT